MTTTSNRHLSATALVEALNKSPVIGSHGAKAIPANRDMIGIVYAAGTDLCKVLDVKRSHEGGEWSLTASSVFVLDDEGRGQLVAAIRDIR